MKEEVISGGIKPMRLSHSFSWTFVGNVVYAASQWAMLSVLAKLGGQPEMVGQFALGLAIASPVIAFTNLALRPVQATDAREEYDFGDYLALRLVMTLLGVLIVVGIAGTAGYALPTVAVIVMMGLAKASESITDIFYGLHQLHERTDRLATSLMLKGVLSLGALGTGVYLTGSVFWGVFGLTAAWLALLLFNDLPAGRRTLREAYPPSPEAYPSLADRSRLRPHWRLGTAVNLVRLTLPMGLATMFSVLSAMIPRYFLERQLGQRELGLYAAMAYIPVAGMTVVSALGQSACPRMARLYAAGNAAAFRGLMLKLTAVGVAIGTAGVVIALAAGRPLLSLLYRPEYADRADVFVWLTIAALLGYIATCFAFGMTAARYFNQQPYNYAAVSAVGVVACALLIPRHGLLGATWSLVLMNLTLLCSNLGRLRHALNAMTSGGRDPSVEMQIPFDVDST